MDKPNNAHRKQTCNCHDALQLILQLDEDVYVLSSAHYSADSDEEAYFIEEIDPNHGCSFYLVREKQEKYEIFFIYCVHPHIHKILHIYCQYNV